MQLLAPLVSFYESLLLATKELLLLIRQWSYLIGNADIMPGVWFLILVPLLWGLYLASGFLSATFTEIKGRSRVGHFFGGLVLPVLYPVVASQLKNIRVNETANKKERENMKRLNISHEVTAKFFEKSGREYVPTDAPLHQEKPQEEPRFFGAGSEQKMTMIHFKSLMLNPDGSSAGPFRVTTVDDRVLDAERIVDAMDEVVVFETRAADGKIRTIRVRYENIAECLLLQ
ncbi:MAG: hypothetical protein PHQ27_03115 [Victivallales bacterium]|nr:hypothetical protein [Victivallales bacterium]